jgi:hypothetical protein
MVISSERVGVADDPSSAITRSADALILHLP